MYLEIFQWVILLLSFTLFVLAVRMYTRIKLQKKIEMLSIQGVFEAFPELLSFSVVKDKGSEPRIEFMFDSALSAKIWEDYLAKDWNGVPVRATYPMVSQPVT